MHEYTLEFLKRMNEEQGHPWTDKVLTKSEKRLIFGLLVLVLGGVACGLFTPDGRNPVPATDNNNDDVDHSPTISPTFTNTPTVDGLSIATPVSGEILPKNIVLESGKDISTGNGAVQPILDISSTVSSFDKSMVYWYPDAKTLENAPGNESGFTVIGGFNITNEEGMTVGEIAVVSGGVDLPPQLAEKFVDKDNGTISWVVLTSQLEKVDPANPNVAESDGLAEVVGWDNPAAVWGVFLGDGQPNIRIAAELGDDGVPTGRLIYSVNNPESGQTYLTINPDMDDGLDIGPGASKNAAPALIPTDLVGGMQSTVDQLNAWGVPLDGLKYTYHADVDGDLGVDLGDGAFLTIDGNVLLHVDGASFDEVDPDDVKFGADGRIKSIAGYELKRGVWVDVVSPTEKQFNADMDKWKIDLDGKDKDKFETVTAQDGKISLVEKESGETVYIDGSWDPLFLGSLLVEGGKCKITPYLESEVGRAVPNELKDYTDDYGQPLTDAYLLFVNERIIKGTGMNIIVYYLGKGCWGQVYYNRDDQPDAWFFWKDTNGKPMYERVFLTPGE